MCMNVPGLWGCREDCTSLLHLARGKTLTNLMNTCTLPAEYNTLQYSMPSSGAEHEGVEFELTILNTIAQKESQNSFLIRPASQALDACASLVQEARTVDAKKHRICTTSTRTRCQISRVMKYTVNCCKLWVWLLRIGSPTANIPTWFSNESRLNNIKHGKSIFWIRITKYSTAMMLLQEVASRKRVAHWKPNNHQWRCQARP